MKNRNFSKALHFILSIAVLFSINPRFALALIPTTGSQPDATVKDVAATSSTPTLGIFSVQVNNGNSQQITGLFSEDIFALPVLQQPGGHPEYVNTKDNTVTQFSMATSYGSLGFLAHNFLAGRFFSSLSNGGHIDIVYGDGHFQSYTIVEIRSFQATSPSSVQSNFVDLATGDTLTAAQLFYQTYGVEGNLVLQTCISAYGNDSWGRLFVIAVPSIAAAESPVVMTGLEFNQSISYGSNFHSIIAYGSPVKMSAV